MNRDKGPIPGAEVLLGKIGLDTLDFPVKYCGTLSDVGNNMTAVYNR